MGILEFLFFEKKFAPQAKCKPGIRVLVEHSKSLFTDLKKNENYIYIYIYIYRKNTRVLIFDPLGADILYSLYIYMASRAIYE